MPALSTRGQTFISGVSHCNSSAGRPKGENHFLLGWSKNGCTPGVDGIVSHPPHHTLGNGNKLNVLRERFFSCLMSCFCSYQKWVTLALAMQTPYPFVGRFLQAATWQQQVGSILSSSRLIAFLLYFWYGSLHAINSAHLWTFTSP